MKPNSGFPFGSASSFGHPGAGGSLGFADPEAQIEYAYVPNRKGTTMGGDPRDVALRRALFSATPAARTAVRKSSQEERPFSPNPTRIVNKSANFQ
ncbi:MAG TPA: hypothetical protein VFB70_04405 [Pyrinomonadaceae bacterium]|nr:hypothetical protein [Pyrinomonadaceae bacterium]